MRNVTTFALLLATAVLAVTTSSRGADRMTVRERTGGCQAGLPAGWSDAAPSFSAPGRLATLTLRALSLPPDEAYDLVLRTVSRTPTLEVVEDGAARLLVAGSLGGDERAVMVLTKTAPACQGTITFHGGFAEAGALAIADTIQPVR